jgi:hypothetical protein
MINFNFIPALAKSYNEYRNKDIYPFNFDNFVSTPCVQQCKDFIKANKLYPFMKEKFEESTLEVEDSILKLENERNLKILKIDKNNLYNKYLKSIMNKYSDNFYGELWLGTYDGNWHLKIISYNNDFNFNTQNVTKLLQTNHFYPICKVCVLFRPLIIKREMIHELLGIETVRYSASLREYFENLGDKLVAKISNQEYFIPVEENKEENWYKYIFQNIGFVKTNSVSIVETSLKSSEYYHNNKLSFYQMLSLEFVKATLFMTTRADVNSSTFDNMEEIINLSPYTFPNIGVIGLAILNNVNTVSEQSLNTLQLQFQQIKDFLKMKFDQSDKTINHGYVPKLINNSRIFVDISNFINIEPTFDDNFLEIINIASNRKIPTMSWRDYNANVNVYNNLIAPKLNLVKKKTKFTNLDNNLKHRMKKIHENLNEMKFYDLDFIQDCVKEYFSKEEEIDQLIVRDLDYDLSHPVITGKKTILENEEIKDFTDDFKICLEDKLDVDTESLDKLSDLAFEKGFDTEIVKREISEVVSIRHLGSDVKKCGVKRGNCKYRNYKDFINAILKHIERNYELSTMISKSKNRVKYLEDYLNSNNLIRDYEFINKETKALEYGGDFSKILTKLSNDFRVSKSSLKILKTSEDFSKYFKIKGFSRKIYTKLFKEKLMFTAEDDISFFKTERTVPYDVSIYYNQKTMQIEIDGNPNNFLNKKFQTKRMGIQIEVLENYKSYLGAEYKTIQINLNKLVDSIKYYICKNKINNKNSYKKDKNFIMQMKRSEFMEKIGIIVDNNYLNKNLLNVKKGVRNFLRKMILYYNFENVFSFNIPCTLKI